MSFRYIFFLMLICCNTNGQQILKTQSTPVPGSGAYVKNPDAFSFTQNPAVLSSYDNILFGLFNESRFLMDETAVYSLSASLPTDYGGMGLNFDYTGFSKYSDYKLSVAYGKGVGSVAAGITFSYSNKKFSDYGNEGNFSGGLGLLFKVNPKFSTGIQVTNMIQTNKSRLPVILKIGAGYQPSTSVFLGLDFSKEEFVPAAIFLLLSYNYNERFHGGIGFNTSTVTFSGTAGVSWNDYRVDISVGYHRFLGFTPGVTLFAKMKK